MSIIANCRPDENGLWPEGAWINIEPVRGEGFTERETLYGIVKDPIIVGFKPQVSPEHVLHTTWIGCVLSLGEDNGYDDSDFWAIVWDIEVSAAKRITYATTRAWTYDRSANVDATPEVLAAYGAKVAYERRRSTICFKRGASRLRAEYARIFGVRPSVIRRLEDGLGPLDPTRIARPETYYNRDQRALSIAYGMSRDAKTIDRVLQLAQSFISNKLRSEFKKKLAAQVVAWLNDPAPQYPTPLSKKQLEYV